MISHFTRRGPFRPWLAWALLWSTAAATGAQAPEPAPQPLPPASPGASGAREAAKDEAGSRLMNRVRDTSSGLRPLVPPSPTILAPNVQLIDLNTALRLAGVQNPDLLIARQRVVEAVYLRQLAAAQFLPSLNYGGDYDTHTGVLQQSNGNILSVNRSSVYVGAGTNAVAAGTVNIPGLVLTGNVATAVYGFLTSRQFVREREFATLAIRNQAFLRTTQAYCELLRAEGARSVAMQVREEARRVAKLTEAYAKAGQGTKADANRGATELAEREADFQAAEGYVLVASARLCEVLNLDPSIRLHPTDAWVVPASIVPDPIPVCELIALALVQRPELGERRAVIREALLSLEGSKVLPFSPTILLGFSSGGFGGGSNLVRPVFGAFGGRNDLDAYAYWTLQNLGVGNLALINLARSRVGVAEYQQVAMLDLIRAEVAEAYARTHARFNQIGTSEEAVRSGMEGFREDLTRIEGFVGLPIEVINSLNLLARARTDYLNAIVDYNEAQFQLYVALGQPPADALSHPVPTAGVVPHEQPMPMPASASATPGGTSGRPSVVVAAPARVRSPSTDDATARAGHTTQPVSLQPGR
jgi:outer membrane protein TolC